MPFDPNIHQLSLHPGVRIKESVIPRGMTVTKAAAQIGIGRPALSNLLNGKAALSVEMAQRIAKAFNIGAEKLLQWQAEFEAAALKNKATPENVKTHVPPFLAIRANRIEEWASTIESRPRLAVLLRTLVNSTGDGLTKVDFPGNDDAERPGWDGCIESSQGNPWIPVGKSGWEFGVNKKIQDKAESDFQKRSTATIPEEQAQTTLVFVTPRRWVGKSQWRTQALARANWKDVRVYDASDLEQWMEQSIPAQVWFMHEVSEQLDEIRSLDKCWTDWANVSEPPLAPELFVSAVATYKSNLENFVSKPSGQVLTISADSVGEAVAFLAQAFSDFGGESLVRWRDKLLVIDKTGIMPRLAVGNTQFIPIVHSREVEQELAPLANKTSCIVITPRHAANSEPEISLEVLGFEAFKTGLEKMRQGEDDIRRLERESGRSLTVLHRRLSKLPGVITPDWAANQNIASNLIPFMLVGTWNGSHEVDRIGLSLMAGEIPYEILEAAFQRLLKLPDAPVWAIATTRGLVSKLDALHAIAPHITANDLERFYAVAQLVLGEDNPALDLPPNQQWAAAIYGKKREFSAGFRDGVAETLVLLAVHGKNLFKTRIDFDTEARTDRFIRELLEQPLSLRVLEANRNDLPTYAEAAPETFLTLIENDLRRADSPVLALMRPADSGLFGSPARTGLLWALESLAWSPTSMPRAASILAHLSAVDIQDNWGNRPINSLLSIFRSWMPQTAASLAERVATVQMLVSSHSESTWRVCIAQLSQGHEVGGYSYKPKWRTDGYGAGQPVKTRGQMLAFAEAMVEIVLNWQRYDEPKLSDLIRCLPRLVERYQLRVWSIINAWALAQATETEKADLRDKIRTTLLSARLQRHREAKGVTSELRRAAREACTALEPTDLFAKHRWLFKKSWLDESADEIDTDEPYDYSQRAERTSEMRAVALKEVHAQYGSAGILRLVEAGEAGQAIGWVLTQRVLDLDQVVSLIAETLIRVEKQQPLSRQLMDLIDASLHALHEGDCEAVLQRLLQGRDTEFAVYLLTLAPFARSTWSLMDSLDGIVRARYWKTIRPSFFRGQDADLMDAVNRLLDAKRPRAAFNLVSFDIEKVDALLLYRMLNEIAYAGEDIPGEFLLEPHQIGEAFGVISASPALTLDQKAGLEFAYIDALAPAWRDSHSQGIPNLEHYLEAHPEFFGQLVAWVFRRHDGKPEPSSENMSDELRKQTAERAYKLLKGLRNLPKNIEGNNRNSEQLEAWVASARLAYTPLDRQVVGDECVGEFLSHCQHGSDGVWPSEPVRTVLEKLQSEDLIRGMHIGRSNSRGMHARGEGGSQEWALASTYRKWADGLRFSHPYVSATLLSNMAASYERDAEREDQRAMVERRGLMR
jgi:addiction module HigA family antidote